MQTKNTFTAEEYRKIRETEVNTLKEFIRICDKYKLEYFVAFGTAIGAIRHQGFIPWDDDVDVIMLRADYMRFLEVAPAEVEGRYNLFCASVQKCVQGFFIQMSPKGSVFMTAHNTKWPLHPGIKMDIFPYDAVPLDEVKRKKIYRRLRFWNQLYIIRNVKVPFLGDVGLKETFIKIACHLAYYAMKIFGPSIDKIVDKYDSISQSCEEDTGYYVLFDDMTPEHWYMTKDELFPAKEAIFEGIKVKIPFKNDEILTRQYGDYMTLPDEEKRVGHDVAELKFPEL